MDSNQVDGKSAKDSRLGYCAVRFGLIANRRRTLPAMTDQVALFVLCMFLFRAQTRDLGEKCQTTCKPGSVPAAKRGMTIHLGRPLPNASRDRPGRRRENNARPLTRPVVPTWSCSRWGLPCRCRYRQRGALLPHPFTLAGGRERPGRRSPLCGTVPGVAPAGRYPAPCFRGARTFLPRRRREPVRRRPSGRLAPSESRRLPPAVKAATTITPAISRWQRSARRARGPGARFRSQCGR